MTMTMSTPEKGKSIGPVHANAVGSDGIHAIMGGFHQRGIPASPISFAGSVQNPGSPRLYNSKSQLLRVTALYGENGKEEETELNCSRECHRNTSRSYYSDLDKSKEESEFYLNLCTSSSSSQDGDALLSPLSICSSSFSSASSTTSSIECDENDDNNEFLTEARASLKALDDWNNVLTMSSIDSGDGSSSCGASCNTSSYEENSIVNKTFDTESACGFDEFVGTHRKHHSNHTRRSCPEFSKKRSRKPLHPASTKSWLEEMKDQDLQQRQIIAEAIAASSSKKKRSPKHRHACPASPTAPRIRSRSILRNPTKLFLSKEPAETDPKAHHPKSTPASSKQNQVHEKLKLGRQKLMASLLRARPRYSPASFASRQSSLGKKHSKSNAVSPTTGDSKDMNLKRAFFGNAKVLTMDGIVESFASSTDPASLSGDDLSPHQQQAIYGRQERPLAPTSDAPLAWV